MIARPLNLASHLRGEPRNFDYLFVANAGLLALFFVLFGSRFVLSPGLAVDFQLPKVTGAQMGAVQTTDRVVVSVKSAGLIFVDEGALNLSQLRDWLKKRARLAKQPSLLILASAEVSLADLAAIISVAREENFVPVVWAAEEAEGSSAKTGR